MGVLGDALAAHGVRVGRPILVRYGRVKLAEQLAAALDCPLIVYLLGERPGGDEQAARSLSAYLVFRREPSAETASAAKAAPAPPFEYSVISNIHAGGLPPLEAGAVIAEKALQILNFRAAGNRLEALLAGPSRQSESQG